MDTTTAIVLGVTLVVVGVLAYKAMQPPAPPASSSSGVLGALFGSGVGTTLATRFNEALNGEREWW